MAGGVRGSDGRERLGCESEVMAKRYKVQLTGEEQGDRNDLVLFRARYITSGMLSDRPNLLETIFNPSSELNQNRQDGEILVRETERKLLRLPGESKQTGDEID